MNSQSHAINQAEGTVTHHEEHSEERETLPVNETINGSTQ